MTASRPSPIVTSPGAVQWVVGAILIGPRLAAARGTNSPLQLLHYNEEEAPSYRYKPLFGVVAGTLAWHLTTK